MRQQSLLWMWLADGKVGPPQLDEYETDSDADLLIKGTRMLMLQGPDDNQMRTLGYSIEEKKQSCLSLTKNTETQQKWAAKSVFTLFFGKFTRVLGISDYE